MLTNPYAGSMGPDAILNLLSARLLIEPPVVLEAHARKGG